MQSLDDTDLRLLELLTENGRESWKALADEVGMSAPSVLERVRKLEKMELIRGFTVRLDPRAIGLDYLAFVSLVGSGPSYHDRLMAQVRELPEVQECHVTSGAHDYLLKIRCSSSQHLMQVLRTLRSDEGLRSTQTTVTLATLKEDVALPLRSSLPEAAAEG